MKRNKKLIERLTPEQTSKIATYVSDWVARGLTVAQQPLEKAVDIFSRFQTQILKKKSPDPVVLCKSPTECWNVILLHVFKRNVDSPILDLTDEGIVNTKEYKNFAKNLKFVYPYFDCQYWAGFFAFYDFMKYEVGVKYDAKTDVDYELLKECQPFGMVFPIDGLCVVSQPPTILKKNSSGLHCDGGPAVSYNGDNEIYALNGVVMDKKYVMTLAEHISPTDILKEKNADVRRELIRKVGIERMLSVLPAKLLHRRENYELYTIDLTNGDPTIQDEEPKNARFLKMINPSIGCFHLEAVGPGIATVDDALNWRNSNKFTDAEILT